MVLLAERRDAHRGWRHRQLRLDLGADVGHHRCAAGAGLGLQSEMNARQPVPADRIGRLLHADGKALLTLRGRQVQAPQVQYCLILRKGIVGGAGNRRDGACDSGKGGKATLGVMPIRWSDDGWPEVTPPDKAE